MQARRAFLLGAELVTIGGLLLFTASQLVDASVVACEEEEGEGGETEGPGA